MSEFSNNRFKHPQVEYVIAPEAPSTSGGVPSPEGHQNPNRNRKKIIGGAIASLAGIALVAGIGIGSNHEPRGQKPAKAVETSAPANPVENTTPKAEVSPAPESTNEFELTGATAEQTKTVEEMDAMSLYDFAHLSYADRFAYAYDKWPQISVDTPNDQQLFDNPSFIVGEWQDFDGGALNRDDTTEGAKVVSANYYYTTVLNSTDVDDSYMTAANSVIEGGGEGNMLATTTVFDDSGEWQSGNDREGNPIDFIDVTSHVADNTSGKQLKSEVTNQVVRQEIKLLDGKTVIAYPRAYGIDGKKSPIKGGTY